MDACGGSRHHCYSFDCHRAFALDGCEERIQEEIIIMRAASAF